MPLDLQQKLLGSTEPRIWTPPLRPLYLPDGTPDTDATYGFAAIAFAETALGLTLDPWQEWLLIHALEIRRAGGFRFRNIVVLVGRQNGKSTLSQVLSLFFLYMLGTRLVLGTAQDLDTATEVWQGAVDLVMELDENDQPVRADLHDMVDKIVMVNGQKSLNLTTKARYKVKAANRRGGRGLTGDLIILDELREHQTWDAWAAITGTTNAKPNAQIWALSNAGDATSVVLRYLRKKAHAALGDPDGINAAEDPNALLDAANRQQDLDGEDLEVEEVADDTLGIFEWSAPPGCAIRDRSGWAWANPSLGYGRVTERTLQSKSTEPEWVFRTEALCQWSEGTLEGPFPAGSWDKCRDRDSRLAPDSPVQVSLDVSWDRGTTTVCLVGLREPWPDPETGELREDLLHCEVLASAGGTEWVASWLLSPDRNAKVRECVTGEGVVIQATGAPASSLIEGLRAAGVNVLEWKGADVPAACGDLYDKVAEFGMRHRGQPLLDIAAATAVAKPSGDGFLWDRKRSPVDITPLVGITGAAWFLADAVAAAYDILDSVL